MNECLLTNARIVLADEIIHGTLRLADGRIAEVAPGRTAVPGAEDCDGDYLLPGLVELHTDNLEKHLGPRPGVVWPVHSALAIHDAQVASAGITTVFDALCIGEDAGSTRAQTLGPSIDALRHAVAHGHTRVEHWLHLRCEVSSGDVLELLQRYLDEPLLKLLSVMDHTPGQRQWMDLEKYRIYTQKHEHWSDARLAEDVAMRQRKQHEHAQRNRHAVVRLARERGVALASHDDTTLEHVAEGAADGVTVSEFPTTLLAAQAARVAAQAIVMGAPNVVRGGSHSGNVSAASLARAGLLDVLSSDYVPASLLHAAFMLVDEAGWTLPQAMATVTRNPARLVGMDDRGEIAPELRGDVIRVRSTPQTPLVRAVWCGGRRVG
ncbi:alpha-D-ribose 1-methylphosphonate 5-triphosphate diphosphatase [Chitiniphilus eburneus]|uniref:Alpha-D-ribose 1-methylphosphonate 5-triphosphate diphosphatase n=1 Tax=Chitiniphilus eburneus TaxID=2571148 RepID=A0A4U0P9U8_9NEIS|nr:alpha-D-ribose 1-methylphosphonate 5-triphosphate diphosphatase [Chitiniphilus eburneus]TJZ64366.1 alpha-D-ribose 1-methylphosphonate 5-triphosphate diphosphatase [Chitiniphilus eburneus]